jgi:DnaJ-class molecular chaperone
MMKKLDKARSLPLEERKRVFKDLQRQLHPDKNMEQAEAAKLAFQKLMEQRGSFLES